MRKQRVVGNKLPATLIKRSACHATGDCVKRGLAAVGELPESPERSHQELHLHTALCPALMAAKGYGTPEVDAVLTRARILSEQLSDSDTFFRVQMGQSNCYWVSGRLTEAYETNLSLIRLARSETNPFGQLRAHAAMGELLVHTGRLRQAKQHFEKGVRSISPGHSHAEATWTPAVACLCFSALILVAAWL